MKKLMTILLLLGWMITAQGQFNGDPFNVGVTAGDPAAVVAPAGTVSLTSALGSAANGAKLELTAGLFVLDKATIPAAADSVYLTGKGWNMTMIWGGDSLIVPVDSATHIFLENLYLETTGLGNGLLGYYHFTNCYVRVRHADFKDSVWAWKSVLESMGEDSLSFSGFSDLVDCEQRGYQWSFGRATTNGAVRANLVNCFGYSTVSACLHIPDENRNTLVNLRGGVFETTANTYTLGANNEAILNLHNVLATTNTTVSGPGNAALYAHDSVLVYVIGGEYNSVSQSVDLSQAFYSIYISTPDTVRVEGVAGNNVCKIDSSAGGDDGAHTPPIVVYWRSNNFESTVISMTNGQINTRLYGNGGGASDYRFGQAIIFRDVTTGGFASGVAIQTITTTGSNKTLIYPGSGQIKQQGDLYLAGTSGRITADLDGLPNTPVGWMTNTANDSNWTWRADTVTVRDALVDETP